MKKLSHVSAKNRPRMVDVGAKTATRREAVAESVVKLPAAVAKLLRGGEIHGPKGPVIQTAIVAGTMAVKNTVSLIPFCHPLPIEGCDFDIKLAGRKVVIRCWVSAVHKTGVEMEALVGVSAAALTVYDMCKAVDRTMAITDVHLVSKHKEA